MATQYAPQIITNGLVLALDAGNTKSYPGTGTTWFDKSGNNYNGTFFNGPVFNTGSLGNIVFDGTDDSCRLTLSSQLSNSFTFCAFVKPTINSDNPAGIVVSEVASYNNYWAFLGLFQQKWHWALYDGSNNPYIVSDATPSTTSWSYVVGVRDVANDVLRFYVNGVLDTTIPDSTTSIPVYSAFSVGAQVSQPFGQTRLYNGAVATTHVYNRVLSNQEIIQNYNALKTRFGL